MRLIRLLFLVALAFVSGIFYERNAYAERCRGLGGNITGMTLCEGGQR